MSPNGQVAQFINADSHGRVGRTLSASRLLSQLLTVRLPSCQHGTPWLLRSRGIQIQRGKGWAFLWGERPAGPLSGWGQDRLYPAALSTDAASTSL